MDSIDIIINETGLDTDCAYDILDKLKKVGVNSIKSVGVVSHKSGYMVKIEDIRSHCFFVGLGSLGYVEFIREESEAGDFLYVEMNG